MSKRVLTLEEFNQLKELFGERITTANRDRKVYSHDVGVLPAPARLLMGKALPAAIVKINSENELVSLIRYARERGIPIVPRAAATSGYGGVVPTREGIVADLTRLNKIIEINEADENVLVEASVVWEDLEKELNKKGLSTRTVPSSAPASTVGGWLAQGGAGYGSYAYGWFRENVLSARVVLPTADIAEYSGDEMDRISGAMGTTGIITHVRVKVRKQTPEAVIGVSFKDHRHLADALKIISEVRLPLWSVGFGNPNGAALKNKVPPKTHHGHPVEERVNLPEEYILLIAFAEDKEEQVRTQIEKIVEKTNGTLLAEKLATYEWAERFKPMKIKRIGPSLIPMEVVVPLSNLESVLRKLEERIKLPIFLEGTVVSGKEVVLLGFIPHDERKFSFNFAFLLALSAIKIAKENGGRVYASGLFLSHERKNVFKDRLATILNFKKQVDPNDILNPDKIDGLASLRFVTKSVSMLEPVSRRLGNLSKVPLSEKFTDRKGIPGDVAWYAYTCAQCGYCVKECDQYYGRLWESQSPRGKWYLLKEYIDDGVLLDQELTNTFLSCTTCELCNVKCQLDLPIEPSWTKMRDTLVGKKGFLTIPPFEIMAAALRKEGNIWANYSRNRDKWVPTDIRSKIKDRADIAYFAGCTASYVENDMGEAAMRLLDKAGVEFTYLGSDEACCGIPMLVAGKWEVFSEVLRHNVEQMKKRQVKTVVTSCPACFLVWKTYYPEWAKKLGIDFPFQAKHYSEVISEKIDSGEFEFNKPLDARVTWHDSCHIGRAAGVYDAPRKIIKAIPGTEFVEMEHNRENAHCCGSVLSLISEPPVAYKIGGLRLREAEKTGADIILALCPCCEFQFRVSAKENQSRIKVQDLATFACRSLGYELKDPSSYVHEMWAVFDKMIDLLRVENMAGLMEELFPQMISAMPGYLKAMMRMAKRVPGMLKMMGPIMPKMMPMLMPSLMPKVMPDMLSAVEKRIPMPDFMRDQMPELMPKAMESLMPKMLPEIAPIVSQKMIRYIGSHKI